MRYLFLLVCVWFMLPATSAAPFVPTQSAGWQGIAIALPPSAGSIEIDREVYYQFETEPVSFEEIAATPASQWKRYPGRVLNFQTHESAVWLRFDLQNSIENSSEWLLKFKWPYLDYIEVIVYHPEENKWEAPLISGLAIPMKLRPLAHRNFLFPLTITPGQRTTIYIRVMSKAKLILPMVLWKEEFFPENDTHHVMLLGLYFGVLSVMLLYNISLFSFTQDKSFLFYSIYIIAVIFYNLMGTGIGTLYLWDNFNWLKIHAYHLLSAFCFITAILFVRHFLTLKDYSKFFYHINNVFLVIWTGFIVATISFPNPRWVSVEDFLSLLTTTLGLFTGIHVWIKGNVSARYFTIGWGFLIFSTFILLCGIMGILEFTWFIAYSQMMGFMIELVLLSLALADRIKRERVAREEAQQIALQMTQKVSKELENRVHERTIDLKKAMLRLKRVNKELAELTITDPLTKVYNRRFFDEAITNEVKRANRTCQPLAVIMVDIDHFKSINDTHGHQVGDKCLFLVAKTLRQQMARSMDLVARFGGEEFVLLLTATPKEKALLVAEKVRRAIEKLVVLNKGMPIELRVSLGVAAWIPDQDESHEQLIKAADDALYLAKRNGRNQVAATRNRYRNHLNKNSRKR